MRPKTLTGLLALGGLSGMLAVHFVPEKVWPAHTRTILSVAVFGLLLATHRNPLRMLYKDASNMLAQRWNQNAEAAGDAVGRGVKVPR